MLKIIQPCVVSVNIFMENNTVDTQITIADLNMLKNIIDLASSRGAFRANELTTVGETYEKLCAFLDAVVNQASAQTQGTTEDTQPQGTAKDTQPQGESK
jgi:hypothetical protein